MFCRHNIKKPTFEIVGFDDCQSGPRYKYVIDSVVYNFLEPHEKKITISWLNIDNILILNLIDWEFKYMPQSVCEDYKPILLYNGIKYSTMSEKLIENIVTSDVCVGTILLNLPLSKPRSQILLFKGSSHEDSSWLDDYYQIKNQYLIDK